MNFDELLRSKNVPRQRLQPERAAVERAKVRLVPRMMRNGDKICGGEENTSFLTSTSLLFSLSPFLFLSFPFPSFHFSIHVDDSPPNSPPSQTLQK